MDVRLLTTAPELKAYEEWIAHHPDSTLWQSPAWRTFRQAMRRETRLYGAFADGRLTATALVIIDKTVAGLSTWDIPRGPLLTPASGQRMADGPNERESAKALLARIAADARADGCMAVYSSPIQPLPETDLPWTASDRHEQPDATLMIDLTASEEEMLSRMHQKGRYNIKVAQKHGVRAEESSDAEAYARLAAETAARDGFKAPGAAHFAAFLRGIPGAFLLLAKDGQGTVVAGLIGAVWKECGIYYYGASSYAHRQLMAPYLLQLHAMRRCKDSGCLRYDLLGVAPPDAPENHPWRGITSFKEKFGGKLVIYPPECMLRLRPMTMALLRLKRRLLG